MARDCSAILKLKAPFGTSGVDIEDALALAEGTEV
jgi:hypothetical protein